jgi:hypothetical protein
VPHYVWRCRTCDTTLKCDPRCWPALDEAHDTRHLLEGLVRSLTERVVTLESKAREVPA